MPLLASGEEEQKAGAEANWNESRLKRLDDCPILFAEVGKPFTHALAFPDSGSVECRDAEDASGSRSRLPQGLRFDAESSALIGVPRVSGFHAYVAWVTQDGQTRKELFLIDVRPASSRAFAAQGFDDFR